MIFAMFLNLVKVYKIKEIMYVTFCVIKNISIVSSFALRTYFCKKKKEKKRLPSIEQC